LRAKEGQKTNEVENLQDRQSQRLGNTPALTEAGKLAVDVAARFAKAAEGRKVDFKTDKINKISYLAESTSRMSELLKLAGVPPRYQHGRIEDFSLWLSKNDPDWTTGGYCLRGPTGNGKSSLAGALVKDRLGKSPKIKIQWIPILDFISRAKSAAHPTSKERPYDLLRRAKEANLIVIDDLGKERGHDWDKELLTTLLWQAWDNEQDLIITTNLTLDEIDRDHPAMASRLATLRKINLGDRDLRIDRRAAG